MNFIDDEAECSSEDDVSAIDTQTDGSSRAEGENGFDRSASDNSEFEECVLPPIRERHRDKDSALSVADNQRSKYDDHIHVPVHDDKPPDIFVTQITQQWSSPSRIRGARWMKPRRSASPVVSPSWDSVDALKTAESHATSREPDEFDDDDDDLALLEAFNATETASLAETTTPIVLQSTSVRTLGTTVPSMTNTGSFRQTTLHGIQTTRSEVVHPTLAQSRTHNWPLASRSESPTHHKINRTEMQTWVYPINLGSIREYQYNIVHKGLFNNLLVALPTGLGKTFIAATVMLNWFRWTTEAQIIFVAPTKPLVSQQVNACLNIAGIPRSQTTLLTGETSPAIRAEEWQDKRVFFMTPQTLVNDLKRGYADPKKIVLVVVDEAHKSTGNYAYVEVVKFLRRYNSSFRVLALTATPGSTVESVQSVIDGLGIARVEIRTEESMDIRRFVHNRDTEIELFDNSDEIAMTLELFCATLQPLVNKLCSQNAYWTKNPEKLSLFGLRQSVDQWAKSEAGRNANNGVKWMVRAISTVLMSLAHNLELLKYHGIGPFYHKMKHFADEASGGGKYAKQVAQDENFLKMMNRLRAWINHPDFIGHPKLSYLQTVVLNHFMDANERGGTSAGGSSADTRIMVFAHYRDSAEEIVRVLDRHKPTIRARVFVGQSGTKGSEGMDQKTQIDIIKKFKDGTYNTIVATSIGEEGLDIGEVDLIVCYDCSKSPIRMLQRMGRTGRKRAGRIVLLLMRGKEEQDYNQAKDNYLKMQAKIEKGTEFHFHDELSPRIIPREIEPVVNKTIVDIPIENTQTPSLEPKKRKGRNLKAPKKKFHMPDGVETGFAFVGSGKKASKPTVRGSKPRIPATDLLVAPLPKLQEILLTEAEEDELDQSYVRLAGEEDQYIQRIRFDAYPRQQAALSQTDKVQHSAITQRLVAAYKSMRDPLRDWDQLPRNLDEFRDLAEASFSDTVHLPSPEELREKKKTSPRRKKRRISSGLKPGSDVARGSQNEQPGCFNRRSPQLDTDDDSLGIGEPDAHVEDDIYGSATSAPLFDSGDDDVPDLATLMKGGQTVRESRANGPGGKVHAPTKRVRRIIDSDDDDDDD